MPALRHSLVYWLLAAAISGFTLGKVATAYLGAQEQMLLTGSDSTTNLPVGIQTDGSNALKVIGK